VFEFKQLAHKNLSKRYQLPEQLAVLRQATLLDVRLRDFCYIEDPVARAAMYQMACADVKAHAVRINEGHQPTESAEPDPESWTALARVSHLRRSVHVVTTW